MLAYLLRRLAFAAGTLVIAAVFAYGTIRVLRPELYEGQATLAGLWSDVTGALLHLQLGEACMFFGCPPLRRLWLDGIAPGWPPSLDIPTLQALALWASVLIVLLSLLGDLAIMWLDPRIRSTGRRLG